MSPNIKKIILWSTVITVLIVASISTWAISKSVKIEKEKRQQTLFPRLSTVALPTGVVGENYEKEVMATIVGDRAKLKLEAKSLPEGFSIKDCKTTYNIESLEKPNTLVTCKIVGKSSEPIVQNVQFITSAKDYAIQIETELTLSILEELPE